MFPYSSAGPIYLAAWVQIGGMSYQAEIVEADGSTRTAQVVRLGTLVEQCIPFAALASVALKCGSQVIQSFGRPPASVTPEWVRHAEVS
jgi:hypothetical protein